MAVNKIRIYKYTVYLEVSCQVGRGLSFLGRGRRFESINETAMKQNFCWWFCLHSSFLKQGIFFNNSRHKMKFMSLNLLAIKIIISNGFACIFNFWMVLVRTWNYCLKRFFNESNIRVLTRALLEPFTSPFPTACTKALLFFSFTMVFGLSSI